MPSRLIELLFSPGLVLAMPSIRALTTLTFFAWFCFQASGSALAQSTIRLTNGFVLKGSASQMISLNQNAFTAAAKGSEPTGFPITVIDDGLKRVYVHNRSMVAQVTDSPDLLIRLNLWHKIAQGGKEIGSIGSQTTYGQFNRYGRRWATTVTPEGPLSILQGITEINARYVQIRGLQTAKNSVAWDMRVSTSAIPGEAFERIFEKAYARDDLDRRLDVVNFYIEAERFDEARKELQSVIREFPEADQLPKQFQALTQRQAQQILDEAVVRRDAGQYVLARAMWEKFLQIDGIARIKRLEAQDRIEELEAKASNAEKLLTQLRAQVATLPPDTQAGLLEFVDVIQREMTMDTLVRLSDYERLGAEKDIELSNRIALAVGGWLLGAGSGLQNLSVAKSLIAVRSLVYEYLGNATVARREEILEELSGLEGAQAEYVQLVLRQLPPPLTLPWPMKPELNLGDDETDALQDKEEAKPEGATDVSPPGYFEIDVETQFGPTKYAVQLPPEYNPYRKYQAIVALHPLGSGPDEEIVWWAGGYSREMQMRTGQAFRRGYVVIAPVWARPGQTKYEYTAPEHDRVLASLRDAMRRISIDSDRVFLAGHLAGGSAAWDIALAHPDLWAGLVSIGGDAEKYVNFYEENARHVPMYFVSGDIAGAPSPLLRNGSAYDSYMKFGYEAMVVLYEGRGDETFFEDVNNIFDWMDLSSHRRTPMQREIEAVTMREGDQFFWWIEFPELLEQVAIHPILFEQATRRRDAPVSGRVAENNSILVNQVPASKYNILLSPEMGIDMRSPITVRAKGGSRTHQFEGNIRFMLEDARRRADLQHVYWDQVNIP
jgi:pimeloyl-ACP methyl ester carboxylesterase